MNMDSIRAAIPVTNHITPQQAIHPAKIIQIMIQSGLLLNRASAAPTSTDALINPAARTRLVRPSLLFSNLLLVASAFLAAALLNWAGSSCCARARATVSRLVPQARQNFAPSRFWAAHRGQYIVATCY